MNIGAVITVAGEEKLENASGSVAASPQFSKALGGAPLACCEILGLSLLERTLRNLRSCGVQQESVLFEESGSSIFLPSRFRPAGAFFSSWEAAVAQQLQRGAEHLILIRLGAYLDIDFSHLLRFHRETSSALTQVYDEKTAFEIAAVSVQQLNAKGKDKHEKDGARSYRARLGALIPYHRRYSFRGYSNRLREPQDFRRMVRDSLLQRTSLCPIGEQIGQNVWMGLDADVDPTVRVSGPAYFGANSRIKGACTISGATSIERDCKVDFGTTIADSYVLPGTYVGMGLNVVNSIVAPGKLINLSRNIAVDVSDRRLVAARTTLRSRLGFAKPVAWSGFLREGIIKLSSPGPHL